MSRRRNENGQRDTIMLNRLTNGMYETILRGLYISSIKVENFPMEIDVMRFFDMLMRFGRLAFFKDDILDGYVALPLDSQSCTFDVYGNPSNIQVFSPYNGQYRVRLNREQYVLIYNNCTRTESVTDLSLFARRLYELERTIDVNVMSQKSPTLFVCESVQEETDMRNLMMKYTGNEPYVFGRARISDSIKPIYQSPVFVGDKLQMLKRLIMSEAYTYMGIDNNPSDKKERLITSELDAANGAVEAMRQNRMTPLIYAEEQINRMFGLDIHFTFNESVVQENVTDADTVEDNLRGFSE